MGQWRRKDIWKQEGRNFLMEVSRHEEVPRDPESGCYDAEGPHRWCVYVYVYPKHPDFALFDPAAGMREQPSYGFHCGTSYFRVHRKDDGAVSSFQIGCDYNHLDDTRFTRMATQEDARSVFRDADEIFAALKAREET